jgi:hypothetical protein
MIKAEVIDAMLAAGCTAEQIAAAVKADIGTRSKNAERQARFKAKKKSESVTSNVTGVTETVGNVTTPSADKEKSPIPPKEINSTPETSLRSEAKKATRISPDFQPDLGFAESEGFSRADAQREAMKFRDYWVSRPGKDGTKLDWPATWRYWIRNASSRRPARSPSRPESEFAKHQRECTEALERSVYGEKRNEQFASNGATLDLEPGNWRPH